MRLANRRSIAIAVAVAVLTFIIPGTPAAQGGSPELEAVLARDVRGGADNPLIGRYEGSVLFAQTVKDFDEITLPSGPAEGKKFRAAEQKFTSTVTAQGRITRSIYIAPPGRSALEVTANFVEVLTMKGFEPVFSCMREACGESFEVLKYRWDNPQTHVLGKDYEPIRTLVIRGDNIFTKTTDIRYALYKKLAPEGVSYVAIYAAVHGGSANVYQRTLASRAGILVEIAEPRAMERRMVVVSAAEISGKIATEGKAAFYGIFFDFDKADIKAESEQQLSEMAKFLQASPPLRVFIIGHTDNMGTLDYNVRLSGRRAEAVVKALAGKYGIDPRRMTPRGLASLAAIASNRTDEGRAKNRRVELVEQ
jgi:OmpA-OmpF porin, OOP family